MKALVLFSGGLDSIIAVKIISEQNIDVKAINFITPFYICEKIGVEELAKKLKIPLKVMKIGKEYFKILRKPKHGFGKNMNPCIDCRILMFKKAKEYAKKIKASFIFTGEVLNERPMSQSRKVLYIIDKEAGLEGKVLRPLSAKLLPATEAEKKGWVDREKLLDIQGRQRKPQIELAKKFRIDNYPSPSGGCLLTYKEFSNKVKDLFEHKKKIRIEDTDLLRIGRHFRFGKNKIIVGRNEKENEQLLKMKGKDDYYFEVPDFMGPITILQGPKIKKTVEKAAGLTARYSDVKEKKVSVRFGKEKLNKKIIVKSICEEEVGKMRII
ncbi:MAG: tRNA 4-thiouridine(8) synthase ThiI [Candidatus Aenigmarchaeota archaeon]|nr:tRNA 4-thiouridine(8) synthase ThiI [Candidatus Aenigmarchaeota archaeon]